MSHRPEGGQAEPRLRLPRGPGGGVAEPGRLAQRVCRQRLLGRVRLPGSLQRTTRWGVSTYRCELRQDTGLWGHPCPPKSGGWGMVSGRVAQVSFLGCIS